MRDEEPNRYLRNYQGLDKAGMGARKHKDRKAAQAKMSQTLEEPPVLLHDDSVPALSLFTPTKPAQVPSTTKLSSKFIKIPGLFRSVDVGEAERGATLPAVKEATETEQKDNPETKPVGRQIE